MLKQNRQDNRPEDNMSWGAITLRIVIAKPLTLNPTPLTLNPIPIIPLPLHSFSVGAFVQGVDRLYARTLARSARNDTLNPKQTLNLKPKTNPKR